VLQILGHWCGNKTVLWDIFCLIYHQREIFLCSVLHQQQFCSSDLHFNMKSHKIMPCHVVLSPVRYIFWTLQHSFFPNMNTFIKQTENI
jgi:hypothetical protein